MKGTFIVLEGGEGAGKSTVAKFLRGKLPQGRFLFTREPGGTPFAEEVRQLMISSEAADTSAETQLALVFSGRFDHVKKVIAPALRKGMNVISERFDSATYGYQIFGQEAPALKPLFFECRKMLGDCVPDLYILLDVEPEEGLRRMRGNRKKKEPIDQFERRELAFHERVRAGLKEFFKTAPSIIVDANRPVANVQRGILSVIRKYLRS